MLITLFTTWLPTLTFVFFFRVLQRTTTCEDDPGSSHVSVRHPCVQRHQILLHNPSWMVMNNYFQRRAHLLYINK